MELTVCLKIHAPSTEETGYTPGKGCDCYFASRKQTHSSKCPVWRTNKRVTSARNLDMKGPEADRLIQAADQ